MDDRADLNATVGGYRLMTDLDTGTGAFPTAGQFATGLHL